MGRGKKLRKQEELERKAFRELEIGGFIERQNNSAASRETSKWAFSNKWYADNIKYKNE